MLINIDAEQKAILQFSGGKDSTALLYLTAESGCLHGVEVAFVNSGAILPEIEDHIAKTCEVLGARLTVLRGDKTVIERTATLGLPTDLVPAWSDSAFAWLSRDPPPQLFQAPMSCCSDTLWAPMHAHVLASGCKLVLRGAKAADKHRGVPPGFVDDNGIRYEAPLWDWTNPEIFAYLEKRGVELPRHYAEFTDSFDCWCCTAYLTTDYGAKKLAYIKREHPQYWPELSARLATLRAALRGESALIDIAISQVL